MRGLLFYENPWRGFDIVIGNPPYEGLDKSMKSNEIIALKTDKQYKTTKVKDLYSLFCETALALANPNGGVVTLVVPLSIAFGRQQESLRGTFESNCREINLRHYDNIPDTIFNGTPVLKTWKNRQRATILTSVLGNDPPRIRSTGLQGWTAAERERCLTQRRTTKLVQFSSRTDTRISRQWLRIPTSDFADLVKTITEQARTIVDYRFTPDKDDTVQGEVLTFPSTAYQFLSALPLGAVNP